MDQDARRAYQQRLSLLAEEIEHYASSRPELAAKAQAERDWLIAELAAATGLNARGRQFAGADERARIAVGKAIRRALDRIGKIEPTLGAKLKATVKTGMSCCYFPP